MQPVNLTLRICQYKPPSGSRNVPNVSVCVLFPHTDDFTALLPLRKDTYCLTNLEWNTVLSVAAGVLTEMCTQSCPPSS
eukprot:2080397-Rhodomonas_salina.1